MPPNSPRVIMKIEHGSSSSGEICIGTAGVIGVLGFWLDPRNQLRKSDLED